MAKQKGSHIIEDNENEKASSGYVSAKEKTERKATKNSGNGRTVVIAIVAFVVGILLAVGVSSALSIKEKDEVVEETVEQVEATVEETEGSEAEQTTIYIESDEHTHTWVPNYEEVYHDAVYEDVYHSAVYANETTYHTVCNECGAIIDGEAVQHISSTGHSGYSKNVPITNEVMTQAAYTEQVLVSDAYDETVVTGVTCTACGEVLTVDEATAEGITIPGVETAEAES